MKAVISQTIFTAMATTHGRERERLRADYDTNGWPQAARNAALREILKAFAFHLAELVPRAGEWRQLGMEIKVFAKRKHLRPVVVQRAAAWVGMADELQSEHVLDLALLPVGGRQGICQRGKFGLLRRDWHPENDEPMGRIQGEYIVKVEDALQ